MKKKDLLQMPVECLGDNLNLPNFTSKTIKYASGNKREIKIKNFIIRAAVDEHIDLDGKQILIVDLFEPSGELLRRHFQNKKGEYFSYDYENKRVSKAGADMWLPWCDCKIHADEQSEQVIINFLSDMKIDKDESVARFFRRNNQQIKEKRLNDKRQVKINAIHAHMSQIKELPQAVYTWAKNTLMQKSRYIFYNSQPKKKETDGICSHCGKNVVVPAPRAGKEGRCPNCKSKVIFKPKTRFLKSHGFSDTSSFAYFQPTTEGYCIRTFSTRYNFYPSEIASFENRSVSLSEFKREFYRLINGRFVFYKFFNYEQCLDLGGIAEWKEYEMGWSSETAIYPKGLNKLFKHEHFTAWHTDFELIARKCGEIEVAKLSNIANEQVLIGHFANAGLYRLTAALITGRDSSHRAIIDTTQKSVKKALQCSKEEFTLYKQLNISPAGIQLYKTLKEKHEAFDLKNFKYVLDNTDAGHHAIPYLLKSMTLHRLVRYYKEYCFSYSLSNFLTDYKDYIKNATALNYNLEMDSVKFPKRFTKAHDEAALNVDKAKNSDFMLEAIEAMEQEYLERFYYADKKYLIRPPHDHAEVIAEGVILKHCVARYAFDIAKRESIILFIRKVAEPDEPFYTLELDPDTLEIRQNRGYRNNYQDTEEMAKEKEKVIEWAKGWQKTIIQRQYKIKTA